MLFTVVLATLLSGSNALQSNISVHLDERSGLDESSASPGVATVLLDDSESASADSRIHEHHPTHISMRAVSIPAVPASGLTTYDSSFDDMPKNEPVGIVEPASEEDITAPQTDLDFEDDNIFDENQDETTEIEFEDHYRKVWNVVKGVRRHKHTTEKRLQPISVKPFFESALVYEWFIFAAALGVFVALHYHLQDWPSTTKFHAVALFIWLAMAGVYNAAVCVLLGKSAGVMWFTGYLLEFIFSIENVFVFHIIVKAFGAPRKTAQKALFVVVCCQVAFEMVFFMGLAARVRSMEFLPYLLGVWLLYVGYHAASEGDHEQGEDFNFKDSLVCRVSEGLFGQRLSHTYEESGSIFVVKGDKLCVSLLLPLIIWLLAVDFFLEVDVTLTKIEELPNEYISFTSSAAAAFAVPELFFVAQDLFQRYRLLKYGIAFVLMFFGCQMLLHRVFAIPDLVGCAIIICVMVVCMLLSKDEPRSRERTISNDDVISKVRSMSEASNNEQICDNGTCRKEAYGNDVCHNKEAVHEKECDVAG